MRHEFDKQSSERCTDLPFRTIIQELDVSGFNLKEQVYAPNLQVPRHAHGRASIGIVFEGTCTETYGDRTREHADFLLHYFPPGHTHSMAFGTAPVRSFDIKIPTELIEKIDPYRGTYLESFDTRASVFHDKIFRIYSEFCGLHDVSTLAIEGLALDLVAQLARRLDQVDRTPPRWLFRARDFIDEYFADPVELDVIAESVGRHPVHLAREFRKQFDCTVGDYIRMKRIEFACRHLMIRGPTLSDIALAAGFCDQSHLSRTFKRTTGMTPGQYRSRKLESLNKGSKLEFE